LGATLAHELAYNADGVRTSKTVAGDTTECVLDLAATLPVVISDTQAVYLYGLDIVAQQEILRQGSGQAPRLYYVHDGLGSVRQLLDTTGQIETNYAYDPFGVPLVGGEVYNPYQFTGEAWDAEVGLLYLRSRYYQPEVGRFVTRDAWPGDPLRPGTLNGYVYVVNSPVNLADATGMDAPNPIARACMLEATCPNPSPNPRYFATKLRVLYGIMVGGPQRHDPPTGGPCPEGEYAFWSDWIWWQLQLVERAAADFADKMEGGAAGLRSKVAPVHLYKREDALVIPFVGIVGGWTQPISSVTLPGTRGDWGLEGGAWMKGVVVHELAHVWDFFHEGGRLSSQMASGFWYRQAAGCQVAITARFGQPRVRGWQTGHTRPWLNPSEDWADSVVAYVYPEYVKGDPNNPRMGEISESRWYFVAQQMNPGNPDRFPYPEGWRAIVFEPTDLTQILSDRDEE
jgi:RHS repeat-associated protein